MREGARVAHSVEAVAFLVLATVRGGGRGGRSQNDCSFRGGVWYGGDSTDVTMMAVGRRGTSERTGEAQAVVDEKYRAKIASRHGKEPTLLYSKYSRDVAARRPSSGMLARWEGSDDGRKRV